MNWFRRHFVPHIDNAYRPHFLMGNNVRQLLAVIVGFELLLFVLPTFFYPEFVDDFSLSAVLPGVLTTLTNEARTNQNLPALAESALLNKVAELKVKDMASKSYFAHTSPEGLSPWYWFKEVGYQYAYAGENLAVNFSDSSQITDAWLNSPTHRANIVGRNYREVGTAVGTGMYKGRESMFVVQVYATPKPGFNSQLTGAIPLFDVGPIDWALTTPYGSISVVLLVVLVIIISALVLNVFIKFDRQHPDLIKNGLLLSVFIVMLYFGNQYLVSSQIESSFVAFEGTEIIENTQ